MCTWIIMATNDNHGCYYIICEWIVFFLLWCYSILFWVKMAQDQVLSKYPSNENLLPVQMAYLYQLRSRFNAEREACVLLLFKASIVRVNSIIPVLSLVCRCTLFVSSPLMNPPNTCAVTSVTQVPRHLPRQVPGSRLLAFPKIQQATPRSP